MNTKTVKKQTSFRLSADLLETLKAQAKATNRSLNNYVESALMQFAYREPNAKIMAAMQEATSGKELETLDLDNFDNFVQSL